MGKGTLRRRSMPKRVRKGKRTFTRQPDGRYVADDDGITILDALIIQALTTGNGPTHGCTIDHSAGFVSGDGEFGGAGASASPDNVGVSNDSDGSDSDDDD